MAALDGELVLLLTDLRDYEHDPSGTHRSFDPSKPVAITVQFTGDAEQFAETGFTVSSSGGGIAYGLADIRAIRELASLPAVLSIRKQRLQKLLLDDSIPNINARSAWARQGDHFSGYSGKDVLVGIIDTGIDFTHHAFRMGDASRIFKLWDQTLPVQAGESHPRPINESVEVDDQGRPIPVTIDPAQLNYGVEYDQNQITRFLQKSNGTLPAGDEAANGPVIPIRHKDDHGHGTHVAGIAAGDGSQKGGCAGAYTYIGVAPDADLIVVRKYGLTEGDRDKPAPPNGARTMTDAIKYMLKEAKNEGRPLVINLSMGFFSEFMDGSSDDSIIIDQLLSDNSTGRAIVFGAGNDGDANFHASGTVEPENPLVDHRPPSVSFRIHDDDTKTRHIIILPRGDDFNVKLVSPADTMDFVQTRPEQANGQPYHDEISNTANGAGGRVIMTNRPLRPDTRPRHGRFLTVPGKIEISIRPAAGKTNKDGVWRIFLTSSTDTQTRFDAICVGGSSHDDKSPYFTTNATTFSTLTQDATGFEIISVGAYKVPDKLAEFSARGPTFNPPGDHNIKPDICAPGVNIRSTGRTSDTEEIEDYLLCRCCCGCCEQYYKTLDGTSMAAPHVAGVIALMLHKNPTLTHQEIRELLIDPDNATPHPPGATPDEIAAWGAGRVNVFTVMNKVTLVNEPEPVTPMVAADPLEVNDLHARLLQTERGQELEEVFKAHSREVITMINTNKRVATLWHRLKGPVWTRHMIRAAFTKDMKIPDEIEGIGFYDVLAKLGNVIKQYASQDFLSAFEKYETELLLIKPGVTIQQLIDIVGNSKQPAIHQPAEDLTV